MRAQSANRRLNPYDRAERNAKIVAARCHGDSWTAIGCRNGVSARQARRIVKDVGRSTPMNATIVDPGQIVTRVVREREAIISQLAEIAVATHDPVMAIKAIEAQVRAADGEVGLLRSRSASYATLADWSAARRAPGGAGAIAVLHKHGVSDALKAELCAALVPSSTAASIVEQVNMAHPVARADDSIPTTSSTQIAASRSIRPPSRR